MNHRTTHHCLRRLKAPMHTTRLYIQTVHITIGRTENYLTICYSRRGQNTHTRRILPQDSTTRNIQCIECTYIISNKQLVTQHSWSTIHTTSQLTLPHLMHIGILLIHRIRRTQRLVRCTILLRLKRQTQPRLHRFTYSLFSKTNRIHTYGNDRITIHSIFVTQIRTTQHIRYAVRITQHITMIVSTHDKLNIIFT